MEFINLKAAYLEHKDEFDAAIMNACSKAAFIGGEQVALCERNLSEFANTKALTCSDGTNALIIALKACGIGAGDEVITSAFTFAASAEAIELVGARVVFADIKSDFCLDANSVKAAITPKTKAILAVSLFGNMARLEQLKQLASEHNLLLIEDAAQSFGARSLSGARSCSVADISTTSFFPSKPLGCFGDGGAIFSNNDELLAKARLLASHGSAKRYEHEIIGTNSRLDAIQAAILNVKLKYFNAELARRNELASKLLGALSAKLVLPRVSGFSAWAQFSVLVANRDKFCADLASLGIPSAIHYPLPLHLQPAYAHLGYKIGDLPMSELISKHICSLPFSAWLSEDECEQIISSVNQCMSEQDGFNLEDKKAFVLGCGVMGKNHLRELAKSGYKLYANDEIKQDLSEFGDVKFGASDEEFDLAIIATPTSTHAKAAACIKAKCLIIEKPLCANLAEAKQISQDSFIGFNERFNKAFLMGFNMLSNEEILSAKFVRQSAKPERIKDADVAMDLGSHDLDLARVLGFNLDNLELIARDNEYFEAKSDNLSIIASWLATEPKRGCIVIAKRFKIGIDMLNMQIFLDDLSVFKYPEYAYKIGKFSYLDEEFSAQISLHRFSNLAALHNAASKGCKYAPSYFDGLEVLKCLERLKIN